MTTLAPVDGDPFAGPPAPKLTPVDGDPFASGGASGGVSGVVTDLTGAFESAYDGLTRGLAGNANNYLSAAIQTPIRMATAWQGPSAAFQEGLAHEQTVHDQLRKHYPIANVGGQVEGALGGALLAGPALKLEALGPTLATKSQAVASYLARNGAYGSLMGWLEGDTPEQRMQGAEQGGVLGAGGAVVGPLLGHALQAPINVTKAAINTVRNLFTGPGKDAIAGQVLREASGNFANTAAGSPLPDLTLRTPQATGNPGLASLERTIGSEPGTAAATHGDLVQNGATANQKQAVVRALVGSNAGIEPAILTNQASARGTQAIGDAVQTLRDHESTLWNNPALTDQTFSAHWFNNRLAESVNKLPPSFRLTIQQGPLAPLMADLAELPAQATVLDVNAIRSRVLDAARDASAAGDRTTARAANELAGAMVDHTGDLLAGRGDATLQAYQAARDFTRQTAGVLGYPDFDAILRPNAAGNMRADPNRAFGRFFDVSGGSDTGPARLQGLLDLLHTVPNSTGASQNLTEAIRGYTRAALLDAGRTGAGVDQLGSPAMNLASLNSAVNTNLPWISSNRATAPIAGEVQAVGNAAELLNRPATLRGDFNSTTYEKLRNNDLIGTVLAQSGGSALGAVGGGLGAYEYGPDSVPAYLRVPAGALAGALAGQRGASYLGPALGKLPLVKDVIGSQRADLVRRLSAGLASPAEYHRLLAAQLLDIPGLGAPGTMNAVGTIGTRAAVPALAAPNSN